ncbi:MAG: hypothetical protein ACRYGF_03520 [Janthinobacterium lividum]
MDLRLLGATLWLHADPEEGVLGDDHSLRNLRPLRFGTETEALRALDGASVGHWSRFPLEGIHATLTRSQLRAIGFRGNF